MTVYRIFQSLYEKYPSLQDVTVKQLVARDASEVEILIVLLYRFWLKRTAPGHWVRYVGPILANLLTN